MHTACDVSSMCVSASVPVCVFMCVRAGRLAKRRHGSTEQRADRRAGKEALAWPRRPSLRGLKGVLLAEGLRGGGGW